VRHAWCDAASREKFGGTELHTDRCVEPLAINPAARRIIAGAPMSNNRLVTILAILAGVLLIVIAIIYFVEPAKSLPSFFPGHESGSSHHHTKHGIAALLLGIGAFVLAWFQSGPRRPEVEAAGLQE
jgi:hypothetical protein